MVYDYDAVGHLLTVTKEGEGSGSREAVYSYDGHGNIVSDGTRTFEYNQNNRLVRVSREGAVVGEYSYDGQGRRVKKLASGTVTLYHYDYAGNLIAETDGNGTPHKIVSASGGVVWAAAYLPFGEAQIITETVVNNFRFPGQYYDAESGLHYNWNRYYDPRTGRYLTPDPIGLEGGVNLYVYVLNNPINRTDLLGLRTAVIITADFLLLLPIGSHAAVYIDNNGAPAIYDPAGSYGDRSAVGSADIITGPAADLNKYIRYHPEAGSKVSVFYFYTTPSEEAAIFRQADEPGGASPGFCAISVRNAVNSIGPFKDSGAARIPDILYRVMRDIQNRKQETLFPNEEGRDFF